MKKFNEDNRNEWFSNKRRNNIKASTDSVSSDNDSPP